MSSSPMTCRPADSLHDAAHRLWAEDCGSLPVVDGRKRLVGIITDRDIAMAAYLRGRRLDEIRVADSMSRHVATCAPSDSVEQAIGQMAETRVRRVPICDEEGVLVGMLSLADLTQEAARSKARELGDGVLAALAQITAPRHGASTILTPAPEVTERKTSSKSEKASASKAAKKTTAKTKGKASKNKKATSARATSKKKR